VLASVVDSQAIREISVLDPQTAALGPQRAKTPPQRRIAGAPTQRHTLTPLPSKHAAATFDLAAQLALAKQPPA